MNKRALYNSIMQSVSNEVKRALNESDESDPVIAAADALCADLKTNGKDLQSMIDFMKIVCGGDLDTTDYSSKRFANTRYKGVSYSKLIPELEKRLK